MRSVTIENVSGSCGANDHALGMLDSIRFYSLTLRPLTDKIMTATDQIWLPLLKTMGLYFAVCILLTFSIYYKSVFKKLSKQLTFCWVSMFCVCKSYCLI